jgi:protein SCO1/2
MGQSSQADFGAAVNDVPNVEIVQKLDSQIPLDLEFVDSTGKTVQLGDFFDGERPVVLSLVYFECPMLCGEVLNGKTEAMQEIDLSLGEEYQAVTVSFDPKEDSKLAALKKKAYVDAYGRPGAAQAWHFLTGEKKNIEPLADSVGFKYVFDPNTGQYAHSGVIMVLTPSGHVSRYLFGIVYEPRNLRMALLEASEGNIGGPVEQLILTCYAYDPTTGNYNLLISRLLQIFGVMTVLILGAAILLMLYFERRRKRLIAEERHPSQEPAESKT